MSRVGGFASRQKSRVKRFMKLSALFLRACRKERKAKKKAKKSCANKKVTFAIHSFRNLEDEGRLSLGQGIGEYLHIKRCYN